MSNITLDEIERQSKRITEQMAVYNEDADHICGELKLIADLIKNSEDTSANELNSVINSASDAIEAIKIAVGNNFTFLANMMNKYVSESSENEETAASDIDTITEGFEETSSNLEGLQTF